MHVPRGDKGTRITLPEIDDPRERPTIPAPPPPLHSEVRLAVARVPLAAATVDVVTCDLRRDRRSESFDCRLVAKVIPFRRR